MIQKPFIDDATFKDKDFRKTPLPLGNYEACQFINCNFSNSSIIDIHFSECEFIDCDLSLIKTERSAFKNIKFESCKMLGIRFDYCNHFLFEVYFNKCLLNLSSFYEIDLKNTQFIHSQLQEVDFTNCNLSGSIFNQSDLLDAVFKNSNLEKSDFRTALNFRINPEINNIKKAKFSTAGLSGLLGKYNIIIE